MKAIKMSRQSRCGCKTVRMENNNNNMTVNEWLKIGCVCEKQRGREKTRQDSNIRKTWMCISSEYLK